MNEDFVVRFYFDTRESERDAAKMANRLQGISAALRDMGINTRYVDQAARAMAKMGGATDVAAASANKANRATRDLGGSLHSLGYEALVVGGVFNRAGVAITSALVGVSSTAIDYERSFANVIRTTNDGSTSMDALYQSLIQLSSQIPVTFQDLTEIATLGGQLGIAGNGIDEFASVVARLTAITDLTADAAGTALGRFQALLGVPASEFENLASAILKVGVNSVATETQIVNISTQISSMADFAGFTAEQVVGLAGALASVGAQPELSRGTITRVFTQMSKAISEGGDSLQAFASIAGVSAQEFSSSFGTPQFAGIFQRFIVGLDAIGDSGGDATKVLRDLGITSVRDVPLLLRLAGAQQTVTNAFDDAREGYQEGTELADQYGKIAQTTASRIQILVNNLTNLVATIGGATTGPIAAFVDVLSDMAQGLSGLLGTDFGQALSLFTVGLVALIGVVATLAGGVAFAAGTFLLLNNAIVTMSASSAVGSGALAALSGVMAGAGRAATVLAASLKAIPVALATLGAGAIFQGLSDLASERFDFGNAETAFSSLLGNVDALIHRIEQAGDPLAGLQNALNRSIGIDEFGNALQAVDEQLAALANSGNVDAVTDRIGQLMVVTGKSFDEVLTALPEAKGALDNAANAAGIATDEMLVLAEAEATVTAESERLAASLGLESAEALTAFQEAITAGSSAFFSYGEIIGEIQDANRAWAESVSEDLYGTKDNWQEFYDGVSVGAAEFSQSLQGQIDAQTKWADDLSVLSARGASAFVGELATLGPEGAALAASAVNLTTEELNKLEENARLAAFLASDAFAAGFTENIPLLQAAYSAGGIEAVRALIAAQVSGAPGAVEEVVSAYDIQFAGNPINMPTTLDTTSADNELILFRNRVAANAITIPVSISGGGGTGSALKQASGGYISGPGTGTSDSIPARLSNGEYVIRAASVRRYGTGLFDQLNRGAARFASGGQVGAASAGGGGYSTGIMELGPKSLGVIRAMARQEITAVLGSREEAIAAASRRGNSRSAYRGGNG